MHPTIQTTWPDLKVMAGEFFRTLPTATDEEADNGFKCLTLGYLGLECSSLDQNQAELMMQIASREMLKRDLPLSTPRALGATVGAGEITKQDLEVKRKAVNDAYYSHGFRSTQYDREFDELHTLNLAYMAQQYRKERGLPPNGKTPYCPD
jgi:hypothetical protein